MNTIKARHDQTLQAPSQRDEHEHGQKRVETLPHDVSSLSSTGDHADGDR